MRHLLLPLLIGSVALTTARPGSATVPADHGSWSMLDTYCDKCHNATDWAGGVAFDTMQPGDIAADAKTWEAAVSKLRGRSR